MDNSQLQSQWREHGLYGDAAVSRSYAGGGRDFSRDEDVVLLKGKINRDAASQSQKPTCGSQGRLAKDDITRKSNC